MRILKLWIDGYGRFSGRAVDLHPGLQVILGPNEQGKTTIRHFISDMLYGQKRSTSQRLYDESNELRRPWTNPEVYRGRMVYALDNAREIQIHRNFDRQSESVTIYDLTNARDITSEFAKLRNYEPNFAETHLGVSKAVFLNTATIGHAGIENLGDDDALAQVREKLLSLADTGEEDTSSYSAIKLLEERIVAIGRPNARTRPLPKVRARLAELEQELKAAQKLRAELAATEQRRIEAVETLASLRTNRDALSEELTLIERYERAALLQQIDSFAEQVDDVTQQCFAVSAGRDFPLERAPEVQRLDNVVTTARNQLRRTETDLATTRQQLEQEQARLGPEADHVHADIDPEWDERLASLENDLIRLRERLDAAETAYQTAEDRLHEAQRDLAALPDFSRIAADPVAWLNDLISSYALLKRRRDEARARLRGLQIRVDQRELDVRKPRAIFGDTPAFMEQARNFDVETRVVERQLSQLITRIEQLSADQEDLSLSVPGYRVMALVCGTGMVGGIGTAYYTEIQGVYIPAILFGLALSYFVSGMYYARSSITRAGKQIELARQELTATREQHERRVKEMVERIQAAGCRTMRELEAAYEKYREDSAKLEALQTELTAQQETTNAEEVQTARSFDDLRQKFSMAGEALEGEADLTGAASRAASRFQAYRDAKRRVYDGRERLNSLNVEMERAREEYDACSQKELDASLEIRAILRKSDFPEERKHTSALSALRAYRTRFAQVKHKRGRLEVLQEKVAQLDEQLAQDKVDLVRSESELDRHLRAANVTTIEEWRQRAEQGRQYQDLWNRRVSLIQNRDTLMRGVNLEDLRRQVEREGEPDHVPQGNPDELRRERDRLEANIDALENEEHRLQIELTAKSAGARSLNEIEEEQAELSTRARLLEMEFNAATYAAAVLEEAARDKHAKIAPKLAKLASEYLADITDGAYSELLISRELSITVRIPQTTVLSENPERSLSKGTVDQIYLALRLALIQGMSSNGERIPMLLDDPFTNYDDVRLHRAMRLLSRMGEQNQILLMTCRDDVAKAARDAGAPVLDL